MSDFVITYQSEPDYDEWGKDTYWKTSDWIYWLSLLEQQYGKTQAAQIFYQAWTKPSFFDAFGDVRGDWLSFDTGFRASMRNYTLPNGVNLLSVLEGGSWGSGLFGGVSDVINVGVGGGLSDASSAVSNTTKTLKWLLPVLLVLLLVGVAYFLILKPKFKLS